MDIAVDYGLLELLRLTLVMLVAILLNQPEWVEEYRPGTSDDRRAVGRFDQHGHARRAGSDSFADVNLVAPRGVAPLVEMTFWESLASGWPSKCNRFCPGTVQGTNLYEPLINSIERYRNLRGIVLASDGDWNEGQPPCRLPRRGCKRCRFSWCRLAVRHACRMSSS